MLRFGTALFVALLLPAMSPWTAEAQRDLSRATPLFYGFETFAGLGFSPSPAPSAGQLDSNEFVPFGLMSTTAFGGNCAMPQDCARGVAMPNILTPPVGIYALSGPPLSATALGLRSSALMRVGVRLRVRNADSVPIRSVRLDVHWAARGAVFATRDTLLVRPVPCVGAGVATGVTPSTDAVAFDGGWESHAATYAFPMSAAVGANFCVELSSSFDLRDLLAIESIAISVPPSSCGNGVVETGETCDPAADAPFCQCDACQVPAEGTPCSTGGADELCREDVCVGGACRRRNVVDGTVCDDGDPCSFGNLCSGGNCRTATACPEPVGACHVCDEATASCSVAVPGCCFVPGDCGIAPRCYTFDCDTARHACLLVPDFFCPEDAALPDATMGLDAGVSMMDANVVGLDAGGLDAAGLDANALDAGGFDAARSDTPAPPNVSFSGGSGCRCGVGTRPGGPALATLLGLLGLLALRRLRG